MEPLKKQPAAPQQSEADEVMTAPAESTASVAEERILVASQWRLMWIRFRKHRAAMISGVAIIIFYLIAAFADFLAPVGPNRSSGSHTFAPPTKIYFRDEGGNWRRPFVYGIKQEIEPQALRRVFMEDRTRTYPIEFFVRGDTYKLWALWESDLHLFGSTDPEARIFIMGADRMGRDVFSRVIFGTRVSLTVGLVGVLLSLVLGIVIGGFSGYLGGVFDNVVQRVIEFIRSIPTLPLWMALSAALPPQWSPLRIYFGITVVLSLIGWTGLARVVRSKFLALREEDFVMAARLVGASDSRIIFRHMLPSFMSHIIASMTLAVPGMILGETSLSFLGLGLRPPIVSWGVLLQEAQNLRAVSQAPWLMIPGLCVVLVVLAFNFFGDGLRDAADPYGR